MLQNGFIALHRSLLSWGWHTDPATGWLFVNLLLMANWTDSDWQGMTIKRGQLITGRKALAAQTGLSERQIRTALDHLKSTNELTIKSTNKFSLITIVNYGKFQDVQSDIDQQNDQQVDQRPTSNRPQLNKDNKEQQGVKTRKRFTPPAVEDVEAYCRERGNAVDAQRFVDFYTASGWMRGKTPIRDWKACVRTWERNANNDRNGVKDTHGQQPFGGYGPL